LYDSLQDTLKKEKPSEKLGLYIDDQYFKDIPAQAVSTSKAVMFHLKRTDVNRDTWSVLYGRKTFNLAFRRDTEPCKAGVRDAVALVAGYPDGTTVGPVSYACLEYFPDMLAAAGLLVLAAALLVATIWFSMNSPLIRDMGIPPPGKLAPYSLARFQMALWFVTIVCGLLWIYAVTGDISPIPDGALILMGIGAGTAIGAAAIDLSERSGSKEDYDAAKSKRKLSTEAVTAYKNQVGENEKRIDEKQKQIDATAGATLPETNSSDMNTQLANLKTQLGSLKIQLEAAEKVVSENDAKVKAFEVPASIWFIADILSDGNGIAFHRLQVFAWTMVFWLIFVISLWHKVTMIDFLASQLALMGISGATYLGFKLKEPPKQTDVNQSTPGMS
jgi:hypothetical protein